MISKTFQSCDSIKGSLVELNSLSLYTLNHMGWLQTSHPFGSEQLLRQRELGVLKVPWQEAPCVQELPSAGTREACLSFLTSGSGRMDTRCVMSWDLSRRRRRLCFERQGRLSDCNKETEGARTRLVW